MEARRISKAKLIVVCLSLVAVIAAMALLSQAGTIVPDTAPAITGEAASYPVSADGYTHGSNIGRTASGTVYSVSSASDLSARIANNQNISITGDFAVTSFSSASYSGAIYGNGHTVTLNYTSGLSTGASENEGAIVGTLTGAIYDLNVKVQANTTIKRGRNTSPSTYNMGIIAGQINGGTISNCAVTINSGVTIWAFSWRSGDWPAFGGIVGRVTSGNINNVTVINNGYIKVGNAKDTSVSDINSEVGVASNIAGYINNNSASNTISLQNMIVEGSGTLAPYVTANIGMNISSNISNYTLKNFYNKFTGTYTYATLSGGIFGSDTPLVSYTVFKWLGTSDGTTLTNYYASDADESMMKTGFYAVPDASVEVNTSEYTVGFDPKATNLASSLVVVKSGITGGENYTATIANVKATPYVYTDNYAFSSDGGTVIFRNLSTTASDWRNSGGNFACTIEITKKAVVVTPLPAVNKWESSYTTSKSTNGTKVSTGTELQTAISGGGNIYLANDITDFTGFTHTGTYSGTLDGNGYTIYITYNDGNSNTHIGGLFKTLGGTIKNVRIVLYTSYTRSVTTDKLATGLIAGSIAGGTVDNVYVYIPDGVTFGVTGGGYEGYVGAVAGFADGTSYTIKNTTVDIDGKMHIDGTWVYLAGFVGRSATGTSAVTVTMTDNIFKGKGNFSSTTSNTTQPVFLSATTIVYQVSINEPNINDEQATVNIDGFIHAFKGGTDYLHDYSMYGVLTKNDNGKTMEKWTNNVSNVYDYDSPMEDANNKGTTTGNNYIDVSEIRSTISTTVESSTIKVTPYFPAGDTDNLVLVAGDGTETVPKLEYGEHESKEDGSYKVVTIPKTAITAKSTVTLTEALDNAKPIEDLNQWEHGYVADPITEDNIPEGYVGVSTAWKLKTELNSNSNIVLTEDIRNFRGFTHTKEYSGTLDGNGHTIYIVAAGTAGAQNVGGLVSVLTGTIKNLRVVLCQDYIQTTNSFGDPRIGLIAGMFGNSTSVEENKVATLENVYVYIPQSVKFGFNKSKVSAQVGIVAGQVFDAEVNISNTTVHLDGILTVSGAYVFASAFIGRSYVTNPNKETTDTATITLNLNNLIFKGNGSFDSSESNSAEPLFMGITTIIAQGEKSKNGELNLNGLINAFSGTIKATRWSMYGVVTKNYAGGGEGVWEINANNIYVYGDNVLVDKVSGQGTYAVVGKNSYIDLSEKKTTLSATVEGESTPVTPYFPASDTDGKLYLVAGDGTTAAGDLLYGTNVSIEDGNYSVIAVNKSDIPGMSEVKLTRPVNAPVISGQYEYNGNEQEIVISGLTSGNIDLEEGTDYTITVTTADDLAVTDNRPVNAGSYKLTVILLNNYGFDGGIQTAVVNFEISKKAVTVQAIGDATAPYSGIALDKAACFTAPLGAGQDGTLTLVYSVTKDGEPYMGDIKDTGVYMITASLEDNAVNANYTATSITCTHTVVAYTVQVVWNTQNNLVYNGSAQIPGYTADGVNGETIDITVTVKDVNDSVLADGAIDAGNYTVELSTDNTNYKLTDAAITFEIIRADLTLSVTIDDWTYGDPAAAPVVSGNSGGGTVTYLYVSTDGAGYSSATAPVNAGEYAVTVTVAETSNYNGGTAEKNFTIYKKSLSKPTEDTTAFVYTGALQTYNPAGFDEATMTVSGNTATAANETGYTVSVSLKDPNNYQWEDNSVTDVAFTFVIGKATLTDGTADVEVPYDGAAHGLTITLTGFVNGETFDTASGKVISYGTEEGIYTAEPVTAINVSDGKTVYYKAEFDNYYTVTGNRTITINKKTVEGQWTSGTETVYSGEAYSAEFTTDDLIGDDTIDYVYSADTGSALTGGSAVNAGTYSVEAILPSDNYEFGTGVNTQFAFGISKLQISVSLTPNKDVEYGDTYVWDVSDFAVSVEVTNSHAFEAVPELDAEEDISGIASANAGTVYSATVIISVKKSDQSVDASNYEINGASDFGVTVTIVPKKIIFTAASSNSEYDGEKVTSDELLAMFSASADYGDVTLYVDGTSYRDADITDAGNYTIKISSTDSAGNYEFSGDLEVVYTVKAKALTVTWSNLSLVYTGLPQAPTAIADTGIAGESVRLNVSGEETAVADNYVATASMSEANANYVLTPESVTAQYEIMKAVLGDSTANVSVIYDGAAHGLTITLTGFVNGEDFVTAGGKLYYGMAADAYGEEEITFVDATDGAQTIYYKAEFANYETVTGSGSVTVEKYVIDYLWEYAQAGYVYNGYAQAPKGAEELSGVKGETLVFTLPEGNTDSGRYTASAEFTSVIGGRENTGNYSVNGLTSEEYEIKAYEITVQWSEDDFTYNGTDRQSEVEAYYTTVGASSAEVRLAVAVEGGIFKEYREGGYTFTVSFAEDDANYKLPAQVTKVYNIKKLEVSIVANDAEMAYGTDPATLNIGWDHTEGSASFIEGDGIDFEVTTDATASSPVGGSYNTIVTQIILNNYEVTYTNGVMTVVKAVPAFDVIVYPTEGLFTSSPMPGISVDSHGVEGVIAWDEGQVLVVGTNDYNWTFTPNDSANYEIVSGFYSLTVASVDISGVTITELPSKIVYEYGDNLDVTGIAVTVHYNDGTSANINDYQVDADQLTELGEITVIVSYGGMSDTFNVTVNRKSLTLSVNEEAVAYKVYDGKEFVDYTSLFGSVTGIDGNALELTFDIIGGNTVSNVGIYYITAALAENEANANYVLTPESVTAQYEITKATVVFDWSGVNGEYVYNGSEQTVTGVKVNVNGAAVKYANNTFTDVPEGGVLNVTVSVAETKNIIGASETRAIPVLRATIDMSDVSFDSAEYIFDAIEKTVTVTTVSGTLPWGIDAVNHTANTLTEVGTTKAVAEFVYNANNFNAVENMTATLTITQRPVAIEITSASKVYGDEDPAYTFALAAGQPLEGTDEVLKMWALNASVARDQGEDVGEYALTLTGYDRNYSVTIVSEGKLTVIPREIVFALSGVFQSVYDGNVKEVTVDEALTVASGSLAPAHADIAASGAVSVSFAEGVSIIDAGVYENAIVFTLVGGNYAASFEGVSENVMTADYTVTRREITVKLRDQRLLKEESIDHNAYEITAGTLVRGDKLGITISAGAELDVDRYELVAEYTDLNYDITFESGTLIYAVRAVITAVTPADFLYTGEPFAIDVTINSTAPLVFYINGEYAANNFVAPGHYVVTISASADDTYREPLAVTVIFNILAPEIKHEADGAEISVSTDTGFYPEDSFEIIREQGRENSTIAEMISGEYTIVDGYVLNVSTEGGTVTLGEYVKNNAAGENLTVRIKVPEEYANAETVECVIIRSGEANMETVEVKDGYIEIAAEDVEAVAFIAERETLIAVIIVIAVFAIAMLLLGCFYVFRKKAY